ncbi:uncharacterized protein BT62DRAFT_1075718 [Guyanagaster necrorhizus]|uniref:Uncharacterized protein n=1 Tax=Guyanagaster necrorhizus TaxID=856835 RepID=A0A9P7VV24_9AGAR|nr:uncharacterized protein BT62DRAFT_1075718 [Guyanagaster necrorhizus MCA 3950]KAG7446985.1 hypothetical protein BT62DRAFT_1075718 [Guyanagaster necrorhizus MCA 3950]
MDYSVRQLDIQTTVRSTLSYYQEIMGYGAGEFSSELIKKKNPNMPYALLSDKQPLIVLDEPMSLLIRKVHGHLTLPTPLSNLVSLSPSILITLPGATALEPLLVLASELPSGDKASGFSGRLYRTLRLHERSAIYLAQRKASKKRQDFHDLAKSRDRLSSVLLPSMMGEQMTSIIYSTDQD